MSFFTDYTPPTAGATPPPKAGGPTPPAPSTGSSFFNDYVLPANPERAAFKQQLSIESNQAKQASDQANKPSSIFMDTLKGVGSTVKNTVTGTIGGLVDQYKNPSEFEQSMENSAPGFLKPVLAPVLRTVAPVIKPLVTDVAASIVFNNKDLTDRFTKEIAAGKINSSVDTPQSRAGMELIGGTQKSAPQIIGDVSQAVLGAYTPELFGASVENFAGKSFAKALTVNAAQGAAYGFTFGVAQAASSGSKDPKEITSMILHSTAAGALLNVGISAVTHGFAKSLPDAFQKIKDNTSLPPEERSIKVQSQSGETVIPVNTPATRYKAYLESQGYEPYVSADKLPTIEIGPGAKPKAGAGDNLPVIKFDEKGEVYLPKGMKYEDLRVKNEAVNHVLEQPFDNGTPRAVNESAPIMQPGKGENAAPVPVTNKPAVRVPTLSSKVEANAITNGLVDSLPDLPEYSVMNVAKERQAASDFIAADPERAKRVAMGEEAPPNGVRTTAVYRAMEDKAMAEGDVNTIRDIATKSKVPVSASVAGQEIRLLGDRNPESPVERIQEVQKARTERVAKATGKNLDEAKTAEVQSIKQDVVKATPKPTRQNWEQFINEIQCK